MPRLPRLTDARLESASANVRLAPDLEHRAYTTDSSNNADMYFTDIPPEMLETPEGIASATGQIVHVHMFLRPRPGRTPIDATACTATVRYVVLAGGRAGLYAGGGFIFPDEAPGERKFEGTLPRAVLSLAGRTEGFADRIGEGVLEMRFRVRRDPARAAVLRAAVDRVARTVTPESGVTAEALLADYRFVEEGG